MKRAQAQKAKPKRKHSTVKRRPVDHRAHWSFVNPSDEGVARVEALEAKERERE